MKGELNDKESMCRYCASKLDVHIRKLWIYKVYRFYDFLPLLQRKMALVASCLIPWVMNPFKWGLLLKERICSCRSKFLSIKVDPIENGDKTKLKMAELLPVKCIFLKFFALFTLSTLGRLSSLEYCILPSERIEKQII